MTEKTEAENKAEMTAWGAYMGGLAQSGNMVGGMPLVAGGSTVSTSGTTSEPVTSAKEGIVGGYLIFKAESLEAATEMAKGCPILNIGGNVEVRDVMVMNS